MRSLADSRKAWEGSYIGTTFLARCGCGKEALAEGEDIGMEKLRRELSVEGWRFNDVGNRCLCPKCGPKKYPELYVPYSHYKAKPDADISDRPRVVRRVGQKAGQPDQKEVRTIRRVRSR